MLNKKRNEIKKITLTIGAALIMGHGIAMAQIPNVFEISDVDGNNGFVINGVDNNAGIGMYVSDAGDFNNDGIADLFIAAAQGKNYLIFGQTGGLPSPFNLLSVDGGNGIIINSPVNASAIGKAGDINGDGIDDVVIGTSTADPILTGKAYVVFGSGQPLAQSLNLSALDGSNGFVIEGIDFDDRAGISVGSAGDFNNDGFEDVIIGASMVDNGEFNNGASYVIYGTDQGFTESIELSDINGSNGIAIYGVSAQERSGTDVAYGGDINGDGISDLIIGAPEAGPNGMNSGRSYVVFGGQNLPQPYMLSSLNGSNGFAINGVGTFDFSGHAVSSAGDMNGDGFDDVLIGAYGADPFGHSGAGESYVVFGSGSAFPAAFELSDLDGNNGFTITGINQFEESGFAVSAAGDVNGDGFSDIQIGAPEANNNGRSYLVYGRSEGFPNPFEMFPIPVGQGSRIEGRSFDRFGSTMSKAGDFNNDGVDDFIIGGPGNSTNGTGSGTAYIVYGNDTVFTSSFDE